MFKKLVLASSIVFATASSAHDLWVTPNISNVSKVPAYMAVDITATHGVYRFEKPVSADNIKVFGVDGKPIRHFGTVVKGFTRTSFELPLKEDGTYKIEYARDASYRTTYTIGERDTKKRLRADKKKAAKKIPEGAKNIETVKSYSNSFSFVTNKLPTDAVLKTKGKGFEVVPITHPADYVNGEEISFKVLLDGKPLPGVKVSLESESSRYSRDAKAVELTTNKEGIVSRTFEEGGRFGAKFEYQRDSQDPKADLEKYRVLYAFEVIFE